MAIQGIINIVIFRDCGVYHTLKDDTCVTVFNEFVWRLRTWGKSLMHCWKFSNSGGTPSQHPFWIGMFHDIKTILWGIPVFFYGHGNGQQWWSFLRVFFAEKGCTHDKSHLKNRQFFSSLMFRFQNSLWSRGTIDIQNIHSCWDKDVHLGHLWIVLVPDLIALKGTTTYHVQTGDQDQLWTGEYHPIQQWSSSLIGECIGLNC